MSSYVGDYQALQERKKLLLDELNATQQKIGQVHGIEGAIDIHHPERSPNWPVYRHQEYPKMLYHPIKLNPQIEASRKGIQQRNLANPQYAPLDLPASQALTLKIHSKQEEEEALKAGYAKAPPVMQAEIAEEAVDPLANPQWGEEKRPRPRK